MKISVLRKGLAEADLEGSNWLRGLGLGANQEPKDASDLSASEVSANESAVDAAASYPIPESLQFLFGDATSVWAPLPDVGNTPDVSSITSTISPVTDYLIYSYETVFADWLDGAYTAMFSTYDMPAIVNNGRVWGQSTSGLIGFQSGNVLVLENYGDIVIAAGVADGVMFGSWGVLQNYGNLQVVGLTYARGYSSWSSTGWGGHTHINDGLIDVWSDGNSTGIYLANGGPLTNTGDIIVGGRIVARAVEFSTHSGSLDNSGNIIAYAGEGAVSYGVSISWSGSSNITNSGTITADFAVYADTNYSIGLNLDNSGTITGHIFSTNGSETIENTGIINGNLYLFDLDDTYDGRGGTLNGFVDFGDGNDTGIGGDGNDVFIGGRGDDYLRGGRGDDLFSGGFGDDYIMGGGGTDTVSYEEAQIGVTVDLTNFEVQDTVGSGFDQLISIEWLVASDHDDTVTGNTARNRLFGLQGNDILSGGDNNDQLYGDDGRDRLYGDSGNDLLVGGGQRDRLFGGRGNDFLRGASGNDLLNGGNGSDLLSGGNGNDILNGGRGNDTLNGGRGSDTLFGSEGYDTFVYDQSAAGRDVIEDFTFGIDHVELSYAGVDSFADLQALMSEDNGNTVITFSDTDTLTLLGITPDQLSAGDFDIQAFAAAEETSEKTIQVSEKSFPETFDFSEVYAPPKQPGIHVISDMAVMTPETGLPGTGYTDPDNVAWDHDIMYLDHSVDGHYWLA